MKLIFRKTKLIPAEATGFLPVVEGVSMLESDIPEHQSLSASLVLDKDDLKLLKKNPKEFAKSLYTKDLVNLLKTSKSEYYNTGTSQLTDAQYDVVEDELRERKPNHSLLRTVGAAPTGRKKVKLPYPMPSLDKIKPGEKSFDRWAATHKGPYIASDKEDGSSVEVIYDGGLPSKAYTRGKHNVGQDVSHLIPFIGVPMKIPYKGRFVARQELAMEEEVFLKRFSKEKSKESGKKYENSRNLVAGVVNTLNKKHGALDHIHSIAYEIIEPRMKPSLALKTLKKYGFNVVPYIIIDTLDPAFLTKYLAKRKKLSKVNIDGLVIEQDKKTVRPLAGNPDYAVAFKVTADEDVVLTPVKEVKWTESQYDTLKPVVWIEPVRLAGVTVKKASGFNAYFIEHGYRKGEGAGKKALPIGPGAIVKVTRSGDVIPHIIEVVKPAKKPDMPKVPYVYDKTHTNIVLEKSSDLVKIKRITSFFTTLKIDLIKQGMVKKFIDNGLDSILKIIKATPDDFLEIDGIKDKSAQKLYKAIQDKTSKPIPLAALMKASGHFNQGMGERRLNEILKAYPNVVDLYEQKGPKYTLDKIIGIPGFQKTTAQIFIDGIPKYLKWFKASKLKSTTQAPKVKTTGSSLRGKAVAFTGFRNAELEEKIKANSGTVTNGVTKETNLLLISSPSFTSIKVQKAQKAGIPIMDANTFINKYKL
jgi:DNA ligase (NAD+)